MTAIYMVWNRKGLAIAADQSVSLSETDQDGQERVIHTEAESKIYKPKGKNFVIATAGNEGVNGVPIAGILNQWSNQVGSYDSLEEYVVDFTRWFGMYSYLELTTSNYFISSRQIKSILGGVKANLDELEESSDVEHEILDQFNRWEKLDTPNVFADNFPENIPSDDYENFTDLNKRLVAKIAELKYEESTREQVVKEIESTFYADFEEKFETDFDSNSKIHNLIKEKTMSHLINFIDDRFSSADIMFAGYGSKDWLPTCYVLKLYDFEYSIPWMSVDSATEVKNVWYQELGQSTAVQKFWSPIESRVKREIFDSLEEKYSEHDELKDVIADINSVLDSHSRDTLDPIVEKVNVLSVKKLSFIARQMVSLESFRSFIHEFLPTVGGEIDCIMLTRDSGFNEFDDFKA
jgi:hypothetical protein